jgi:hypothetical protein
MDGHAGTLGEVERRRHLPLVLFARGKQGLIGDGVHGGRFGSGCASHGGKHGSWEPKTGAATGGLRRWTWEILPFVEESVFQANLDPKQPTAADRNASVGRSRPPRLRCACAPSGRSSAVNGVVPSDFVIVVYDFPAGPRRRRDFSYRLVHGPESNTLP